MALIHGYTRRLPHAQIVTNMLGNKGGAPTLSSIGPSLWSAYGRWQLNGGIEEVQVTWHKAHVTVTNNASNIKTGSCAKTVECIQVVLPLADFERGEACSGAVWSTATLHQCTYRHIKRCRYRWSVNFHLFWEGAKLVSKRIQVLLFHCDEKWFMSLVKRMHSEVAPDVGVTLIVSHISHKNVAKKLLVIVIFEVIPFKNDL